MPDASHHAYAVGWNHAIEAAANVADERFKTWHRDGFMVKANEASNLAADIRALKQMETL